MGGLGWGSWIANVLWVATDTLFQRVTSMHVPGLPPLTPLPHLTCIITGCTSGIGLQTAKHLAKSRAHVVFAVRNLKAANELIEEWQAELGEGSPPLHCEAMELDCLSFDSVYNFGKRWEARKLALNVLINNAGIFAMNIPKKYSNDGCETHMQVNHLAPALLTVLLLPSLLRGSPSRIVMVNSIMHYLGDLDPTDLNKKKSRRKYRSMSAYSDSKLAQVMFSNLLQRQLPRTADIDVICVHPGEVKTNVARTLPKIWQLGFKTCAFFCYTPQEGSRPLLFCATDPEIQDKARAVRGHEYPSILYIGPDLKQWPVAKQVRDIDTAHLVWQETLRLVGLPEGCIEAALTGSIPGATQGVTQTLKLEIHKRMEASCHDDFASSTKGP